MDLHEISKEIVRDGDDNDTPDLATELIVNAPARRFNFEHPDDLDWYKFEAEAGKIYVIQTFNSEPYNEDHSEAMDPYIYLYSDEILTNPDVNELDYDDDNGDMDDVENDDWEARIVFECPESGTYYVILRHYNADYEITGSYEISVVTIDEMPMTFYNITEKDSSK